MNKDQEAYRQLSEAYSTVENRSVVDENPQQMDSVEVRNVKKEAVNPVDKFLDMVRSMPGQQMTGSNGSTYKVVDPHGLAGTRGSGREEPEATRQAVNAYEKGKIVWYQVVEGGGQVVSSRSREYHETSIGEFTGYLKGHPLSTN